MFHPLSLLKITSAPPGMLVGSFQPALNVATELRERYTPALMGHSQGIAGGSSGQIRPGATSIALHKGIVLH